MLPPPIPSVRTSSVRSIVRYPPILADCICGRPFLMTEQSELVPPTSIKMPSLKRSYSRAPAMPAAGPESSVRIGRLPTSRTSITPPSLRITISGAGIAARSTAWAVIRAVRTIFGRIAALIAAVRVRERNPYAVLTSWPLVASIPRSRAYATTADSCSGRSTPKLSLAAIASAPAATNFSTAARSASP